MLVAKRCCRSLLFVLFLLPSAVAGQDNFLDPAEAFQLSVTDAPDGEVELHWDIAPDYYLYRHAFSVEGEKSAVADVSMPKGRTITDEYFGRQEVYFDQVTLRVDPGAAERLSVSWQGCAKAGLCYPPQDISVAVPDGADGDDGASGTSTENASASGLQELGEDQQVAADLASQGVPWIMLAFFGMGLLLTFTPCVLPMLPILSSIVVGAQAGPRRGLVLSAAFIGPMALTYAALGVGAGLAGANLQAALQAPPVLIPFAVLFVVLAFAMFGAFELQLPQPVRSRLDAAQRARTGGSLSGAAAMGVMSALLVSPCMTAPLAGALLYLADTGDAMTGGLALLALGLGMGTPLLVVGTFGARILPKPGEWMNRVKVLFGFILLAMAVWFVARIATPWVTLALWSVWVLSASTALWAARTRADQAGHTVIANSVRVAAMVTGIWGAAMLLGAAAGNDDPWYPLAGLSTAGAPVTDDNSQGFMSRFEPVESPGALRDRINQAAGDGRWTVVDVYADWCTSCKVIEEEVFGDPAVQQELSRMQLLRPDVTDNDAPDRRLLSAHDILGPPTIMFFGPGGRERRGQRITGEISAEAFLDRLSDAKGEG